MVEEIVSKGTLFNKLVKEDKVFSEKVAAKVSKNLK